MKIMISGSLAYDKIMDFNGSFGEHILPESIHKLNISFYIEKLQVNNGGTAGNIAYGLAILGEKPTIFSSAGYDFKDYGEKLKNLGVITDHINIVENEITAVAHIMTDNSNNQISSFYAGALNTSNNHNFIDGFDLAIISPTKADDMIEHSRVCKEKNIPYIFDPGQQIPALGSDGLKKCLSGAKYLISNDYELEMIKSKMGVTDLELFDFVDVVVTTLGVDGSIIKTSKEEIKINSCKPKNVSDPTGAGDAYRAGFIKGIILEKTLRECGQMASAISVYCVESYGTQNYKFSLDEFAQRYYDNYGEKIII